MVLPVLHALKGHPESGALWAKHISDILSEPGFTAMIHAPCLLKGMNDGKEVLICKKVDDFNISAADQAVIYHLTNQIGGRV